MPDANITKFRKILAELFMFDRADLDFGIYRIMNTKRDEITRFLDHDLLPQVRESLSGLQGSDRVELEAALNKAVRQAEELDVDPTTNKKVQELRERYATAADPAAMEDAVFSHLAAFFRRYYKDGDFLSLRRYKKDVYALPYEGEEVKLHWANADQYYIKSSENFRDYTFTLADGRRVHFKLVEADTEQNNNKAAEGKERRFVLAEHAPLAEENGELFIRFEYRVDGERQDKLNAEATQRIFGMPGFDGWLGALRAAMPTEKNKARTLLDKQLGDYTASNSFDYFIHKDLGGFLRRELDFYIKNEVMRLDDIEEQSAPRVEQYLALIKAMRKIGHKVIHMLAQLEDFQKQLWLKKKFVVATNYCVTLDRVPEELYAEIAANEAQRAEWVRLFAIDAIVGDMLQPAYAVPLSVAFLKANPFLMLDTAFFTAEFKARLVASFDNLDEQCDGLLIHSENFQALNLLQERYHEQVKCIYIDPPYNTGDDDFPYKDNYQHSSWLSMMQDRVSISKDLMMPGSNFISHIDEHEFNSLQHLLDQMFGIDGNIGPVIWDKRNPKGDSLGIATQHEYLTWCVREPGLLKTEEYRLLRSKRNAQTILDYAEKLIRKTGGVSETVRGEFKKWIKLQNFTGGEKAYAEIDNQGQVFQSVSMSWPNKQRAPEEYFKPLIHPETGKPCSVPERGWRNPPTTMNKLLEKNQILFGVDETTQPRRKYLLLDNMKENVPSLYYFGGSDDDLHKAMNFSFPHPKPLEAAKYILEISSLPEAFILDYFAGSGTTGHAVINLNREDGGQRKYILVEMGAYFDAVTKPRMQKVIYSKDWRDGKPISRAGSSHMFKYIRLESYEDTLNNLALQRSDVQTRLLADEPELREDYMLSYMLEVESRGSASLLNTAHFAHPFDYTLKIATGSAGETRPQAVDLVETFNYLLGLRVAQIDTIRGVTAVTGLNPAGQRVLVLWRDLAQTDNATLDAFFRRQDYTTRDQEFDLIYVNGDNNLENLKQGEDVWKVRVIEEEFGRLMFDVRDV